MIHVIRIKVKEYLSTGPTILSVNASVGTRSARAARSARATALTDDVRCSDWLCCLYVTSRWQNGATVNFGATHVFFCVLFLNDLVFFSS